MLPYPISANFLPAMTTDAQAPEFASALYRDADEQAAALRGWNQSYLQLSGGGFRGAIQRVNLGPVRMFMEQLESAVYQSGQLPGGVLALGMPLHCDGSSVFCGARSQRNTLHVFSGQSGFEFRTTSGHVMVGLELEPLFADTLYHDGALMPAGLRATDPQALEDLRQVMLMLFETAHTAPAMFSLPALRAGMVDTLAEKVTALSLDSCRSGNGSNGNDMAHGTHWQLMQQARALVQERLQQPPTVGELCLTLGVSRRTLQNAFHQTLGISPLAYLRATRLGAVRQALKSASSVTEAATDMGFWHFGHFAKDYQAMFGELPSHTHKRHLLALP